MISHSRLPITPQGAFTFKHYANPMQIFVMRQALLFSLFAVWWFGSGSLHLLNRSFIDLLVQLLIHFLADELFDSVIH